MKLSYYIFLPIIILSCLASIWLAFERIRVESSFDTVNMVMDYDDWKKFCISNGYNLEESLKDLKEKGIISFGVYEDNCKQLQERGELTVFSGSDILNAYRLSGLTNLVLQNLVKQNRISSHNIYIVFSEDSSALNRVETYFCRFLGNDRFTLHNLPSSSPVLEVVGDYSDIMNMGIGLPVNIVAELRENNFFLVPRIENRILKKQDIEFIFQDILNCGNSSVIIFSGMNNEVLGYPDLLEETATHMEKGKLYLGFIEVADLGNIQRGAITLAGFDITRVVRVISMSQAYQEKLRMEQILDIWSLAVRERNIRLLYLRPLLKPFENMTPMETNLYYLKLCKERIESEGYKINNSRGMDSFKRPLWICILLCSGSISAGILILLKIFQIDLKNSFIVGGICFFILLLTMTVLEGFASKLFALSSGIVVPVFAIVYGFPSLFSLYREGQRQKGNNILFALITVCQVSFITVLGSLVTAGILSSTKFFLTVDRFKGIKFIMTLPILLVIILYFYSLTEGNKSSGFFKKCKTFLLHPVRLWEVIIVFIIATGGIFYLIRTGNTSVVPVSDFERNLRAFLDNFLIVRPRFKDFLLGQPALFLTVYLWRRGNLRYLWLFLAFATLGQANIVDTFAHLHTPLLVSLLRVFHGLWIGCIVGFVAVGLYNIFILFEKHFKLRGHG